MKARAHILQEISYLVRELSPSALRLMVCLSFHFDMAGRAWPSLDIISVMTGLSRKSIVSAREELSSHGLKWSKRPNRSTVYEWEIFGVRAELRAPSEGEVRFPSEGEVGFPSEGEVGFPSEYMKYYKEDKQEKYRGFRVIKNQGNRQEKFPTASDRVGEIKKALGL